MASKRTAVLTRAAAWMDPEDGAEITQTQISCGSAHVMHLVQGHRDRSWMVDARAAEGDGDVEFSGDRVPVL